MWTLNLQLSFLGVRNRTTNYQPYFKQLTSRTQHKYLPAISPKKNDHQFYFSLLIQTHIERYEPNIL